MPRIMFSAGELSGDEHGARLLKELQRIYPQGEFFGMGGRNLRAAGLEISVDAEKSASVMGVSEIFGGLRKILASWKSMTSLFDSRKPEVLVIINYSEFNLRLARAARKRGVKVIFYIPPQVWAWRPGRVKEIDAVCDIVATIFPFEKQFYAERGCNRVTFVGHPFAAHFEHHRLSAEERAKMREELGLSEKHPIMLLFPGSRKKEILAHLSFVFNSFGELVKKRPDVQGVLVSASESWVEDLSERIPQGMPIKVVSGDSLKLLQIGDAGLIKSGTSNLQAAFARLPFIMFYRPSPLTAFFIRRIVRGIKQFSIVNILRPDTVPEIVGENLDLDEAVRSMREILSDGRPRRAMIAAFDEIIEQLSGADDLPLFAGCKTASERTARLVQSLIDVQR